MVSAPSTVIRSYDDAPAAALIARHQALPRPFRCTFGGAMLDIDDGVFCPTLTKVSPILLDSIEFQRGDRVLDAFAGSGAFGVIAALSGAHHVVAFDVSEKAVICARTNAGLNHVEAALDVRTGTMESTLGRDEQFDLVIANPPLLDGTQNGDLETAIFDPDHEATLRFIACLPRHLAKQGRCYLATSDVLERDGFDVNRLCADVRLSAAVIAKLDAGHETYRIHFIQHELS